MRQRLSVTVDDVSDHKRDDPAKPDVGKPTEFNRFEALAKRLLHVSKDEVREAEAREQEKRRTA